MTSAATRSLDSVSLFSTTKRRRVFTVRSYAASTVYVDALSLPVSVHDHHHHYVRVVSEGRRVVAPPCPRSTARLQRSPIGRVESFLSLAGRATCSVDDQVGDTMCGQEVG